MILLEGKRHSRIIKTTTTPTPTTQHNTATTMSSTTPEASLATAAVAAQAPSTSTSTSTNQSTGNRNKQTNNNNRNKKKPFQGQQTRSPRRKNARVDSQQHVGRPSATASTNAVGVPTSTITGAPKSNGDPMGGALSSSRHRYSEKSKTTKPTNNNNNKGAASRSFAAKPNNRRNKATKPTANGKGIPNPNANPKAAAQVPPKDLHAHRLQTKVVPPQSCTRILPWKSPIPHVPLAAEEAVMEFLFAGSPKREGLLLRDQPDVDVRYPRIKQACLNHRMHISAALSLRQETISWKNKNPKIRPVGFDVQVRESARLFEVAVEDFLSDQFLRQQQDPYQEPAFWTEDEQREHNRMNDSPGTPTPDILFRESVYCQRYIDNDIDEEEEEGAIIVDEIKDESTDHANKNKNRRILEQGMIHWIDAKMFYGASTIPQNNKCAVGKTVKTAIKYVNLFGPGALCFMYGCGESLAAELAAVGVLALDCSSRAVVSLDEVERHQKTWCGDKQGQVVM
jgi:hypothetical protein